MEIKYLGHASFQAKGKNAKLIFDPFDPSIVGLPFKKIEADIVCVSHSHHDHDFLSAVEGTPYVVKGPGKYEIKGVKISGIPSFHDDESGSKRGHNTIYVVEMDGIFLCHLGDLGHKLTDKQLSSIKGVDVLFIPIGGFYTIDPKMAVEVVAQIEPKIVVPMHYKVKGMKPAFESLHILEDFTAEMGETPRTESVLKVLRDDLMLEGTSLVILENSML